MPSASAAWAMPSIASASSQPISGFSGLPKFRQSVSAERLAAGAGDVAGGSEHGPRAGAKRIALAERRTVERDGEAAVRRCQPQDGRVQARPPDGARAHELVVLLVHPPQVDDRREAFGIVRARPPLDLVARALVGEERGADLALHRIAVKRAQQPAVGDNADLRPVQLPAVDHLRNGLQRLRAHGRHHPLLALGDHDLPGLQPVLAQRDAVEVDVDARAVTSHLGERGGEPGGAAVLERLDEAALDELERDLDQPLAGERVADLHGRALLGRVVAQLLAREHARTADAVAAGRGAEEHESEPRCRRPRTRHALRRQQAPRTSR